MADEGIKKARILQRDLPPLITDLEGYLVRYRIKSSDQNRTSHWSPFILLKPNYTFVPGKISVIKGNSLDTVSWDAVSILKSDKSFSNIIKKSLSSNIATLTTDSGHYMKVGDYVTVSGIDNIFNGTYQISDVTTSPEHTFSYYKQNGNIPPTNLSPNGTYTTNFFIRKALEYDIWLRFDRGDGGDWVYRERVEETVVTVPIPDFYTINGVVQPSSPNRLSVEIYLKGQPPKRGDGIPLQGGSPFLKVYQVLNATT